MIGFLIGVGVVFAVVVLVVGPAGVINEGDAG